MVGSQVRDKLGSVALWLREHNIDIKVIEVSVFNDGGTLLLSPQTIIPIPTTEKFEIGKRPPFRDRPWVSDGEDWHLNRRCGKEMREKLLELNQVILDTFDTVIGPNWNQKHYVSFKENNINWVQINTFKTTLRLNILIKKDDMYPKLISERLEVGLFDTKSSLSEKLQLESSVEIRPRGGYDRVTLRIKREFNLLSESFPEFLQDCFNSFKNSIK